MASRRRGILLVEVMVATLVVTTISLLVVQTLVWRAAQRRASEHRSLALVEAGNLLERAAALDWDALTVDGVARLELSESAAKSLPGAKLQMRCEPAEGPLPGKKLQVEIQLPGHPPQRPVRLSTWVYQRPTTAPPATE